ncbi:hypothetical protein HK101_003171 [Irineochytrium annulatum]|nr:hypothetical protein HK101_003171 [Irineochytrium annulatum]
MVLTPIPEVDPALNYQDFPNVVKARDEFFREQLIRHAEIKVLRDKAMWCKRREGHNFRQNCRHLVEQYMEVMREYKAGTLKPFRVPPPPGYDPIDKTYHPKKENEHAH